MGKRPHLSPLAATPAFRQSDQDALRQTRVRCEGVAGDTHFAAGAAAEGTVIELQLACVESLARLAAESGASVVRIFTADEAEGQDLQANWRRVVTTIRERCDRAARKAAPHTALTPNADYIRVPRHRYRPELVNYERLPLDWVRALPFGTGFIDYGAFFQGLRDGGFDGIAADEMCSPIRGGGALENLDACAAACLVWMNRALPGKTRSARLLGRRLLKSKAAS
jgi:sugar phosphate isomerase/epimerase